MVEVTVRENIERDLENLGDEINADIAKVLLRAANFAGSKIIEVADMTFKNPTGALGRSFLPPRFVQVKGKGIAAAAVSDLPYASIHETGEPTIVPRRYNHLAIPLTSEARSMPARDWPEGVLSLLVNKRNGNLFLVEKLGKKNKVVSKRTVQALSSRKPRKRRSPPKKKKTKNDIKFHYLLRKSVRIPKTGYITKAAQQSEDEILKIVSEGLQQIIDKADKK